MNVDRIALVGLLALAACAADPSREVKSAEATLTSERQQARTEEAKLRDKHVQQQIDAQQTPLTTSQRTELVAKQIEERAETKAEGQKNVAEAEKDVIAARAEMQNERAATESDARARLTKAEAKAWEARNKTGRVPENKRSKFNSDVNAFSDKKTEVNQRLVDLGRASNEEWRAAKGNLMKALEELEAYARRLDDHF